MKTLLGFWYVRRWQLLSLIWVKFTFPYSRVVSKANSNYLKIFKLGFWHVRRWQLSSLIRVKIGAFIDKVSIFLKGLIKTQVYTRNSKLVFWVLWFKKCLHMKEEFVFKEIFIGDQRSFYDRILSIGFFILKCRCK